MKIPFPRVLLTLLALGWGVSTTNASLIAHWPLDNDALDATGNGFDGAVVGGTVTFGQPGANASTGSAALFPDNGHIDVPYDAALNPGIQGVDGAGSFTIALWANSSDNGGFNSPFTAREDNGSSVNGPIIYNNNTGVWSYWAGNNGPPGAWNAINGPAVPLNTWQHVAVTYDSATTTRKMFIDGVEVINQVGGVSANVLRDIHIGSGQDDGLNFYWNGLIDDVGLWDNALSEAEIIAIKDNGIGGGQADPNLQSRNFVEFDYDGVNGDFVIEIKNVGETQDLNIIGTPVVGGADAANFNIVTVPGPIPPAGMADLECSFDPLGGNGVFEATIDIASDDPLEPSKIVTVRMSVHDPFASAPASVDLGTFPPGGGPQIATVTIENLGARPLVISDLAFTGPSAANFSAGAIGTIPGGGMADLELTFTPAGADGTFAAALQVTSDDPITPVVSVSVIARVEITNPLVACWTLDQDATDTSGNGFDGTIIGNVIFGQPGANPATATSANFTGGSHIDVPFDPALNPESFTVTLWANAASTGGFASPITSRDDVAGGVSTHGFILYNNSNGIWDFWTGDGDSGWDGLTGAAVAINTWNHLAISYDATTDTKTLYVDGVVSATDNVPQSGPTQYSPNGTVEMENLHIGAGQDDGLNFFFDGNIDDVGLFRTALTEEQIVDVMDNGLGSFKVRPRLFFEVKNVGADMLSLRWASKNGKLYNVRSTTDPASADPADWPIFAGNADIMATPSENTLTIPRPVDEERFFVIEEFPAPPVVIYGENFDAGQGGWTTGEDDETALTFWQHGTPTIVGPAAANSAPNCFGTNLAAEYDFDANIWLRSPPIDLSGATGATLNYAEFADIEGAPFDIGTITVLDAGNNFLAEVKTDIAGADVDWRQVAIQLPVAALGQVIKLEFRLLSDNVENFAGWYIDDVEVTVP